MSKKFSIRELKGLIDEVITEEKRKTSRRLVRSGKRSLVDFLFEGEDADPVTQGAEQAAGEDGKDFSQALAVLKGEAGSGQPLSEAIADGASTTKAWLQANGKEEGVLELLGMGLEDGDPDSEKILQAETKVPVSKIQATQNIISLHGSVGWPLSNPESFAFWAEIPSSGFTDGRGQHIVAANSTEGVLVLDGHHRWSAGKCMGGDGFSIAAMVFTFPEGYNTPKAELAIGHIAIAAELGTGEVPSSSAAGGEGANILGQDITGAIKELRGTTNADNGKEYGSEEWFAALVSDEGCKKAAIRYGCTEEELTPGGAAEGDEAAAPEAQAPAEGEAAPAEEGASGFTEEQKTVIWDKIAAAIGSNWSGATAVDGPGRQDMPQFGGGDSHPGGGKDGKGIADTAVFGKMKSGAVNFKDPYVAESRTRKSGNLILERWHKLAGLDKK